MELQDLPPEKDGDYELGANIDGVQFNPLNYAPVRKEDIKEEFIGIHQVEGIFDDCENEIEKQGEWVNHSIYNFFC